MVRRGALAGCVVALWPSLGWATPDLVLDEIVTVRRAEAGQSTELRFTVTNAGSTAAGSFEARFRIHNLSTYSTAGTTLCTLQVAGLAAGTTASHVVTGCTIPAARSTGSQFVVGRVDAQVTVTESDETNNTAYDDFSVISSTSGYAGSPDVMLEGIVPPASAAAGEVIDIGYLVLNGGGAAAGSHSTRLRLSTDTQYDVSDPILCDMSVSALSAYALGEELAGPCLVPVGQAAGSYHVVANGDAFADVSEGNEGNNRASAALSISGSLGSPDLTVGIDASPASVAPGDALTLSATVDNGGAAGAWHHNLGWYLSTDAVWDASDTLLCEAEVGILAGGAGESHTSTCAMPLLQAAGVYQLLAVADPFADVAESDELNNVASTALSVSATPSQADGDLALLSVEAPERLYPLELFGLRYELRGDAAADLGPVTVRATWSDGTVACEQSITTVRSGARLIRTLAGCLAPDLKEAADEELWVALDPDGTLDDPDLDNNARAVDVRIVSAPDTFGIGFTGGTGRPDTGDRRVQDPVMAGTSGIGCGCHTASTGSRVWFAGLGVLLLARRRWKSSSIRCM